MNTETWIHFIVPSIIAVYTQIASELIKLLSGEVGGGPTGIALIYIICIASMVIFYFQTRKSSSSNQSNQGPGIKINNYNKKNWNRYLFFSNIRKHDAISQVSFPCGGEISVIIRALCYFSSFDPIIFYTLSIRDRSKILTICIFLLITLSMAASSMYIFSTTIFGDFKLHSMFSIVVYVAFIYAFDVSIISNDKVKFHVIMIRFFVSIFIGFLVTSPFVVLLFKDSIDRYAQHNDPGISTLESLRSHRENESKITNEQLGGLYKERAILIARASCSKDSMNAEIHGEIIKNCNNENTSGIPNKILKAIPNTRSAHWEKEYIDANKKLENLEKQITIAEKSLIEFLKNIDASINEQKNKIDESIKKVVGNDFLGQHEIIFKIALKDPLGAGAFIYATFIVIMLLDISVLLSKLSLDMSEYRWREKEINAKSASEFSNASHFFGIKNNNVT